MRIDWVESRVEKLEDELKELQAKYDTLITVIKKKGLDKVNRNGVDDGNYFLYNYGKERNGPWN
jgi:hypothetical protein